MEISDGLQVVRTDDDRFSEKSVEESQKEDDDMVYNRQNKVAVQTPKRMSSPIKTADAPKKKIQRMERKLWMNSGCDI